MGFRTDTSRIAKQNLAEQLHQEGKIVDRFNDSVFPGVFSFARPVVKTQNLAQNTKAKSEVIGEILRVTIETDLEAVPYAKKAYYGYGEHEYIGARRYLDKIADIAINNNATVGTYTYSRQTYTGGNIPFINI